MHLTCRSKPFRGSARPIYLCEPNMHMFIKDGVLSFEKTAVLNPIGSIVYGDILRGFAVNGLNAISELTDSSSYSS